MSEILKFCSVPAGADSDDACMAAVEVPTSWLAAANSTGCTNVATQLHFQLRERHHVEVRDASYRLPPASMHFPYMDDFTLRVHVIAYACYSW